MLFFYAPALAQVDASYWKTDKSQHFIVYSQGAPDGAVDELIDRAEKYYNGIVEELGFRRFDFWSWDNRARIYLYKDAADFHRDTGRSEWSGGVVYVHNRTIQTYIGQAGFFDSLLPHEMTHIIFREFIGKNIRLPLWIDEGVACSQEKSNLQARLQAARESVVNGTYIKLDRLSGINQVDDKATARLFYSEAASLIVFLIREKGKERFLEFSRALRDGTDWQRALLKVYRFANLEAMEEEWKVFMLQQK